MFLLGVFMLLMPSFAAAQKLIGASISPTSVQGGNSATGHVTISSVAPAGGYTVNLNSLHDYVQVPSNVVVSEGATTATFPITTSAVTAQKKASVQFSDSNATIEASLTLTVQNPVAVKSLVLSSNPVVGGYGVTGTVTLNQAAPSAGAVVKLSGTTSGVTSMPTTLGFPHGTLTKTFRIETFKVTTTHAVTVGAVVIGTSAKSVTLNVTATGVSGVSLTDGNVFAGGTTTGKVTLADAAPTGGQTVTLSSNNAAVQVPASVKVAAGNKTASFNVTSTGSDTDQSVNITGATGGGSSFATLSLHRNGLAMSDWPNMRGNAGNTGQGLGSSAVGSITWTLPVSSVNSTPAIGADGTVYIKTDIVALGMVTAQVTAHDPATGNVLWTFLGSAAPAGTGLGSSPVVAADGTVYVGTADGNLYALDGTTGATKWSYSTGFAIISSPTVGNDGTVYFGSDHQYVYAVNSFTGKLKWTAHTTGAVRSSAAVSNGTVYIGANDGNVYALNASTGASVWTHSVGGSVMASPAVGSDGTVYVGTTGGNFFALNGTNGNQIWSQTAGGGIFTSAAVGQNGLVYFGAQDGKVYALNQASGASAWTFTASTAINGSPVLGSDGAVYVLSSTGGVYALDGTTGTQSWKVATGVMNSSGSAAVGSDGSLYYAFGKIQ
ncbi:MAG TPA: PQQ-binding-like beta-propeller repeat protein [Fimbriimonas sp.]|nr:PQQ-binding-like beta-propeller repeat protein [Fimbriimonas sp.]